MPTLQPVTSPVMSLVFLLVSSLEWGKILGAATYPARYYQCMQVIFLVPLPCHWYFDRLIFSWRCHDLTTIIIPFAESTNLTRVIVLSRLLFCWIRPWATFDLDLLLWFYFFLHCIQNCYLGRFHWRMAIARSWSYPVCLSRWARLNGDGVIVSQWDNFYNGTWTN